MKSIKNTRTLIILFFLLLALTIDTAAQFTVVTSGRLFTVNDTGDSNDAQTGDGLCADANGKCTLRAAIQESNVIGFNVINFELPPASTINLTLGELTITKQVSIVGSGARNLTIQRSPNAETPPFRIFHVAANVGFNLLFRGVTVRNGLSDGNGGGFYIEQGNSARLTELTITENRAARGGAIANAGNVSITRSLISANRTVSLSEAQAGGGVNNLETTSQMTISNSTLTGNTSANGGAIYNRGALLLVNNTQSVGNGATERGGNTLNETGGTVHVLNTIIGVDNVSSASSLWGAFNSLGNNIVTDSTNSTGFTDGVNGDQVSVNNQINPNLFALANNGGDTDTFALHPDSPAKDRGNNCVRDANCPSPVQQGFRLSIDQRGVSRGGSQVDVGAFEIGNSTGAGFVGFGTFRNRPRLAGSIVILTNARTAEKRYTVVNSSGNFRFTNLPWGGAYIFEIRSKRGGQTTVFVAEFDDMPIVFPLRSGFSAEDFQLFHK
jgi:hypothetical protein